MSKYVIDANILFSALIGSRTFYLDVIKNFDLYTPDFVLKEIEKYEALILKKTRLTKPELNSFLIRLFKGITILPAIVIDKESRKEAFELCRGVDEKDTPYIALAIQLDIPLLTNDKKLFNGLKKKGFSNIILFEEIAATFSQ